MDLFLLSYLVEKTILGAYIYPALFHMTEMDKGEGVGRTHVEPPLWAKSSAETCSPPGIEGGWE